LLLVLQNRFAQISAQYHSIAYGLTITFLYVLLLVPIQVVAVCLLLTFHRNASRDFGTVLLGRLLWVMYNYRLSLGGVGLDVCGLGLGLAKMVLLTSLQMGVRGCTRVFPGVLGCTRVFPSVLWCARMFPGVVRCAWVSCSGVLWDDSGNVAIEVDQSKRRHSRLRDTDAMTQQLLNAKQR